MKSKLIILITIIGVLTVLQSAKACQFRLTAEKQTIQVRDTVKVTVKVIHEHRRCLIPIEDTEFELKNFQIVKESKWDEVRRGQYEKTFLLTATEAGNADLEIIRECSRKGRFSEKISIDVQAAL